MVNGINSQSNIYALKDLVNLAKYATGVPLTDSAEDLTVSQVASYPTMMCGYEGYQWLKNNKGQYKKAFAEVVKNGQEANQVLKKSGVLGVIRVSDAKEVLTSIPQAEYLNKLSAASQDLYKKAKDLAEIAKANPANKQAAKDAVSMLAKANASSYAETAKNATGLFAKTKNALGITKLGQATRNTAAKSPIFKKCLDAYNNEAGTFMLAIEGGVEMFTNVVPTFKQLGFKKGMKQLGKSIVRTVASVAGWVAGSAIGTKLGEVVGAAVGNKKVGAVIGAVAGQVGSYATGTIGQHFANKAANKILGKSELEKAKDEEVVKIAEAAQNDSEVFDALVQQAAERLAIEGEDTPESKAVNKTLQNLVSQKNASSQAASPMMSREDLKAYADKLKDNTVTKPVNSKYADYKGYIPSAAAVQINPIATQQQATQTHVKQNDEMTPELRALLQKADRVIKNGSRYIEK